MKKILLLSLLPLLSQASGLKELLQSLDKSKLIKSQKLLVESKERKLDYINASYLPKIELTGLYTHLEEEDRSLFDVQSSININTSYVLFDGLRHSDLEGAQKELIQSQKALLNKSKAELSLEVTKLFFNLRSAKANIHANMQKIHQLKSEAKRVLRLYKAKTVSQDSLEEINAALAMSKYELALSKQTFDELKTALYTYTGINANTKESRSFHSPQQETKAGDSFELLSKKAQMKALALNASAQTSSYLPKILIKDTYSQNSYYDSTITGFSIDLPTSTNKVEVILSMTLFDFFAKSKAKQELVLQKMALSAEIDFKKEQLKNSRVLEKVKLYTAKQNIEYSKVNLDATKTIFDIKERKFKANLIDSSLYLDALTKYSHAKFLYDKSLNDLQIAYASYYYYHNQNLLEKLQ